jgi:hypothetical protein
LEAVIAFVLPIALLVEVALVYEAPAIMAPLAWVPFPSTKISLAHSANLQGASTVHEGHPTTPNLRTLSELGPRISKRGNSKILFLSNRDYIVVLGAENPLRPYGIFMKRQFRLIKPTLFQPLLRTRIDALADHIVAKTHFYPTGASAAMACAAAFAIETRSLTIGIAAVAFGLVTLGIAAAEVPQHIVALKEELRARLASARDAM